jgi:hypothetical protein
MTTRLHRPALTPGPARTLRVRPSVIVMRTLAALTAALFAIDAYVHFDDAHDYDFPRGASITQGDLFRVQASIAIVVAIALLIRPHWAVWILAILIAGSAAGAVFLYTYVNVGRLGPLPNMYEPTWDLPGKLGSAVAELFATAFSVAGLGTALYVRRTRSIS